MTIAAVPMGAAVLGRPYVAGDVLVIKERVRQSYNAGQSVATTRRRDFAAQAALKCITPGRARVRRPDGLQARLCLASKAVMGFIGLGLGLGVFRLADYQIVEADKLRERADARRLLRRPSMPNAAPSTTATVTCWRRRSNVATSP